MANKAGETPTMNLETYARTGRAIYQQLAMTVAKILEAAVRATPDLHLQQVQYRAKDPESLRKKIENAGGSIADEVEMLAKDLAACRLLFYTNSDLNRFMTSGFVTDNFEVDWDRTKIHHPTPATETAERLFMSINYVVRLKPDRASMPEYSHLAGLWCELQVQTSLNHVWAEMEHDMLYKRPALTGFGGKLMDGIQARLQSIMRDHLIPAGYEFQKVVNDFDRLSAGKELFDRDALKALFECNNINDLHDLLGRFNRYVLPNYDDLDAVQADIRKAILTVARIVRTLPEVPMDTPFGQMPGYRVEQVIALCCDVLDQLRYRGNAAVINTFDAIRELYAAATSDMEQKRILESAGRQAENNLMVWRQAGPVVQDLLIKRASELSSSELRNARPVVLELLRKAVEPELTRVSSNFESFTFEHAAPPANAALARMRSAAIGLLQRLYLVAQDDRERREVLNVLVRATALPNRGDFSDFLVEIVFSSAADIVEFLCRVSVDQSFEILQAIEHDLLWLHRRTRALPPALQSNAQVAFQQRRVAEAILAFRRQTAGNRAFQVHKTLVGFESVFELDWEEELTPSEHQAYRDARIKELASDVTPENAADWLKVLSRCAETRSDDMATFPSFLSFLQQLAQSKPSIVIGYLPELTERLSNFLPAMLIGLESGGGKSQLPSLLRDWIDQGKYLSSIAVYVRASNEPQPDMLAEVLEASVRSGDEHAVLMCVSASASQSKSGEAAYKERVFIPAVQFLSERQNTRWVDEIRFRTEGGLVESLSDAEVDLLLSALVSRSAIDYAAEELLKALVPRHPGKVIRFFGARLPFEPEDDTTKYEAIPYQLDELGHALQPHASQVVQVALEWFRTNSEFFTYRGGRFIHAAFPALTQDLERALAAVVRSAQRDDLQFVVDVLQNYNGAPATHDVYRSIIEALDAGDEIIGQMDSSLDATGVVHGEFGQVEAYKSKKLEIAPWLTDPRRKVQEFARRRILSLDRQIAAEQRRSEEQHEFRKREYGV